MVMVEVDSGSLYRRTHSLSRLAWSWVCGRFGAVLHTSTVTVTLTLLPVLEALLMAG